VKLLCWFGKDKFGNDLSSFTASMLTKVTIWEKIVQRPLKRA